MASLQAGPEAQVEPHYSPGQDQPEEAYLLQEQGHRPQAQGTSVGPGEHMKALTMYQPWATLIAYGIKNNETKQWPPKLEHMGRRIAIHAGRQAITNPRHLNRDTWDAITEIYGPKWMDDIPRGVVVATAVLAAAYRITDRAGGRLVLAHRDPAAHLEQPEPPEIRADSYGDFRPPRWLWVLEDVEPIDPPVPARGSLGLWDWEQDPNAKLVLA